MVPCTGNYIIVKCPVLLCMCALIMFQVVLSGSQLEVAIRSTTFFCHDHSET